MFIVFLGGYNSQTTKDIKLKFSAFLSCVEVNKCVKVQIPRYKSFKVGIYRISPIDENYSLNDLHLTTIKVHMLTIYARNIK